MLEWIAPQEYTTNSTDDGQAYDEAWQAQNQITPNDTVRFFILNRNRGPNFFLIFQSKNFSLQKTFLIFVIQTKG